MDYGNGQVGGGGGGGFAAPTSTGGPTVVEASHDDMIHKAQLDFFGTRLATCSSDRVVKVFDITTTPPTHVADLHGHSGPVWDVAWAHPKFGGILASASYDHKVIIHRETEGHWTTVHSHGLHESSVNSISWAPVEYGLRLACASSDGRVSVIAHQDDHTWSVTHFVDCRLGSNAVSWAPYGHLGSKTVPALAAGGGVSTEGASVARLVTAGCDNSVRVHKAVVSAEGKFGDWSVEAVLRGKHTDWVRDVAWLNDGDQSRNRFASGSEDCLVNVWTQSRDGGDWTATTLPKFPSAVFSVSWSLTDGYLAVSCADSTQSLWKETEGEWRRVMTPPSGPSAMQ